MSIAVCGSLNMDFVIRVAHLPAPGETILGSGFQMLPGGKGANQACAAGKLSAGRYPVRMLGRVGYDVFADHLKASLAAAGVDVSYVHGSSAQPTGVATIWVDAQGQNSIVVAPGANALVAPADAEAARPLFRGARYALFQLETPVPAVEALMRTAREEGAVVILDPAPAVRGGLPNTMLQAVGILTPNESEALLLLGEEPRRLSPAEAPEAARTLLAMGPAVVVLKLGEQGCFLSTAEGTAIHVPAFAVDAVDTTAAGDIFNAALAVGLIDHGGDWTPALRFACAAAAISVTRVGAQASVPSRAEVEALLPPST